MDFNGIRGIWIFSLPLCCIIPNKAAGVHSFMVGDPKANPSLFLNGKKPGGSGSDGSPEFDGTTDKLQLKEGILWRLTTP